MLPSSGVLLKALWDACSRSSQKELLHESICAWPAGTEVLYTSILSGASNRPLIMLDWSRAVSSYRFVSFRVRLTLVQESKVAAEFAPASLQQLGASHLD